MTNQEAYNIGLTDAENNAIDIFKKILIGEDVGEFANPEMNKIREVIKIRSDYYLDLATRNNNIGKSFKKRVQEEREILGF